MNLLVAIGTTAAYLYSVFVIFFPEIFPPQMRHVYFDSASAIITFILLGRYLEARSKGKATEFMKKLLSLKPQKARILVDGKEIEIPAENVVKGDILLVKSGEKIPADGTIIEGEAEIDQSMITGESLPVYKKAGDKVIGGTILKVGFIKAKAEQTGKDTVLNQIIKLLTEAQSKKPPIGKLADKITGYFVPAVLITAIVVFDLWYLFGNNIQYGFLSAVSVLIIACPCALGLATPIAVVVAVGRGAKEGILIKNPEIIEIIKDIKFAIFDKTGTLTKGKLKVKNAIIKNEQDLKFIASVEKNSEHPISKAILNFAVSKNIILENPEKFKVLPGKGVVGKVEGKEVIVGTKILLEENKIKIEKEFEDFLKKETKKGHSVVFGAVDKNLVAVFSIIDEIKEESKEVIQKLKQKGIKPVLLTGDNKTTAEEVAKEIGIEEVIAEVLPEEKYRYVENFQKKGKVMFIGDGINDAPAMGKSDIGIAVSTGTELAKETGDIILIKDELTGVIKTVNLSNETLKLIKQNLFWAYIYNTIGIPVAGGILYPFFGILLKPVFAGIAMSFSSVSVVTNSLRLKYKKLD
jgi:Cu2+-exporting ATPase/Cu+-exporting ATPase